jgi:hypothetical protein
LDKGVDCFIVPPEDMMKFETIELLLKLSNLLSVCRHAGVTTIQLPHDLVDNELRATLDVKPLDPKLGSKAQTIDMGLVLHHIVGRAKMQSNYIEEPISLGGD